MFLYAYSHKKYFFHKIKIKINNLYKLFNSLNYKDLKNPIIIIILIILFCLFQFNSILMSFLRKFCDTCMVIAYNYSPLILFINKNIFITYKILSKYFTGNHL